MYRNAGTNIIFEKRTGLLFKERLQIKMNKCV